LDQHGIWDAYANGDYYLDGNPGESRGIGFEITSERMQNPVLFNCLCKYPQAVPETYEIFVNNPLGFSIFVGRDYVHFSGTDAEAQRFGIA
jgi:hypothetical protein